MYQMWAHTMFPKGQFMFTVERIDKVARTAVVRVCLCVLFLSLDISFSDTTQNTLQGIREAFHNPQAITSAEYELEESIPTEASVLADMESQREHGITVVGSTGPTSGPQPLFTERDDDYDDDFEDELAAMEEMERGATQHRPLGSVDFGGAPYDDDMDEIAAMEEAEREAANATSATSASNGAKRTTAEESEFAFDGPEDVDPRKAAAAAATKRANGSAANGSESNATTANRSASASNGSASNGAADANVNDTRPPVSFGDEPPQLDEEDEWEGLYD
jgi:hypothetical protein